MLIIKKFIAHVKSVGGPWKNDFDFDIFSAMIESFNKTMIIPFLELFKVITIYNSLFVHE